MFFILFFFSFSIISKNCSIEKENGSVAGSEAFYGKTFHFSAIEKFSWVYAGVCVCVDADVCVSVSLTAKEQQLKYEKRAANQKSDRKFDENESFSTYRLQ